MFQQLRDNRIFLLFLGLVILAVAIIGLLLYQLILQRQNLRTRELDLSNQLSEKLIALKQAEATQETMMGQLNTQATESAIQATGLEGWRDQYNQVSTELEELTQVNDCQNVTSLDANYQSNASMAELITEWIGDNFESISHNEWDILFNNSQMANHYFSGDHGYWFTVYFDDPNFDTKNGVFFINWGCWIDR